MSAVMMNDENFKQVLWEYMTEKYGAKLKEFYERFFDDFPYDFDGLDDELHFKNFFDWLMIEKPLPDTGKTIVEEFVEEHPELDADMRRKLLGMKNVVSSEFVVISKEKLKLKIKDRKSGKLFNVLLFASTPDVGANTLLAGRIFPFGESYRFAGAFMVHNSPMILDTDVLMSFYNQRGVGA